MAIYHCSLRVFSRSEGHSAVAAAAYRAGAVLHDERRSFTHRYQHRKGVVSSFILAPPNASEITRDRALLWNAAEASETRKNSRVAREVILALPHELTDTERKALAHDMALYLVERYRVAVDVAIHSPVIGDGHDPRNHHAHLLFTTRELTPEGFGKKTRILDDKQAGPQEVELLREVWETLANDALAKAGFPDIKIDRRTLEGQGIERIPQTHIGPKGKNAEEGTGKHKSLKQQFQQRGEKAKDDDEETDSQGETGKQTGNVALNSKTRQDHKGRTIDYKKIDQNRTRLDFNQEIKKLNERRAAFSDVPLKDQIKHVEKLTARLERRQEHLKTLLTKSSLPHVVRVKIETALSGFKKTLFAQDRHKSAFKFSAEEKRARIERQKTRYNRSYRAGLHECMREMEENLNQLEQKQKEYTKFKTFIDKIGEDIRKAPQGSFIKRAAPARVVTNQELSLKLSLKADMIREFIPQQFKSDKQEAKAQRPPSFNAITSAQKKAYGPTAQILTARFQKSASMPETPEKMSKWKQPVKLCIAALEKALLIHTMQNDPTIKPKSEPSERKNWFIPISDKTRPLQNLIDRKLGESKKQSRDHSTLEEKFNNRREPSSPVKIITNEQAKKKIRQEAQIARNYIPPQYRAEPYEDQINETPKLKENNSVQSAFKEEASKNSQESADHEHHNADHIKSQSEPLPRQEMTGKFNAASFNTMLLQKTAPGHNINPENNIDLSKEL